MNSRRETLCIRGDPLVLHLVGWYAPAVAVWPPPQNTMVPATIGVEPLNAPAILESLRMLGSTQENSASEESYYTLVTTKADFI